MKRWARILMITMSVLIIMIILVLHISDYVMSYSDLDIKEQYINAQVKYIDSTRTVYYDNNSDTLIVFVHGAPGDFSAFNVFLSDSIFSNYNLLAYDRPGYGGSQQSPIVSIEEQAKVLLNIINSYDSNSIILIGHSYGCAIAGNLAATEIDLINKLIIIAPLLDPENEPIFWFSYFGKWPLTKWMLTQGLQTCGDEKFAHSAALKEIENSWENIAIPVLHIHGGQDALAPPSANLEYSAQKIDSTFLQQKYYAEEGHLVMWENYSLIKQDVIQFIKEQ